MAQQGEQKRFGTREGFYTIQYESGLVANINS